MLLGLWKPRLRSSPVKSWNMSPLHDSSEIILRIYGYCDLPETDLFNLFATSRLDHLRRLGGEYTLVYQRRKQITILTSDIGAIQYFYYYDGSQFCHGDNVIDIVRRIG